MSKRKENEIDSLAEFKKELNKYPVLSEEEQQKLLKKYSETCDLEVLETLVKHNLRLSLIIAKKHLYNRKSMDLMDLIQECNISLILAIETYDIEKDVKFSSYAIRIMENNLITAISKQDDIIRKPVYLNVLEKKKNKFIEIFAKENGRYPTEEEIKENLKISDVTYKALQTIKNYEIESLNKELESDEEKEELQNHIKVSDPNYEKSENTMDDLIIINSTKEILNEKEYYIIYYRQITDTPRTLESLAEEFEIFRQSIETTEKNALLKLKKNLRKVQKEVINKYKISDLEKEKIEPIELKKKCLFLYLKEKMKEEEYYYIYTRQIENYTLEDYKKVFEDLTEEKIKEQVDFFNEIYKTIATEEFIEQNFKRYKELYKVNNLFKMSIEPEFKKIQKKVEKIKDKNI